MTLRPFHLALIVVISAALAGCAGPSVSAPSNILPAPPSLGSSNSQGVLEGTLTGKTIPAGVQTNVGFQADVAGTVTVTMKVASPADPLKWWVRDSNPLIAGPTAGEDRSLPPFHVEKGWVAVEVAVGDAPVTIEQGDIRFMAGAQ